MQTEPEFCTPIRNLLFVHYNIHQYTLLSVKMAPTKLKQPLVHLPTTLSTLCIIQYCTFSALMLLVGRQEGYLVRCWHGYVSDKGADLHMAS